MSGEQKITLEALWQEIGLCGCGGQQSVIAAAMLKHFLEWSRKAEGVGLLMRYFLEARGWIDHGDYDSLADGCRLTERGEALREVLEEALR